MTRREASNSMGSKLPMSTVDRPNARRKRPLAFQTRRSISPIDPMEFDASLAVARAAPLRPPLDVHFQVILQVPSHSRELVGDGDGMVAQVVRGSDAGVRSRNQLDAEGNCLGAVVSAGVCAG